MLKTILMTYKMQIAGYVTMVVVLFGGAIPAFASQNDDANCWISASPSTVSEGGSTTLSWGSSDAERGWISDIGDVSISGSRTVYDIDEDTTFTFTVENDEGTASCSTKVNVRNNSNNYGSHNRIPGCTIYRENIAGGTALRWNSTNAESAYLSNVGSVSTSGMYNVYSARGTYTLTVYGNGQSRQCELTVGSGAYTYPSTPSYGNYGYAYQQPYVYLSQIPYTGIDLGVVGTMVYFLALMSFAIAGGYLLSYYNGGVMRLSFAQEVKAAARNQYRTIRSIISK